MASTAAYIGLISYLVVFVLMLIRNFNAVRQGQRRRDNVKQFIVDCVYDKHNPAFFSAVLICIVTTVTILLYIGFGGGLIFNIFQQGLYASWLISLFRHFLSVLDPFQRVTDNELNATVSFWNHVVVALTCLVMSMLVWAGIQPTVYHDATTVNLFFMGIALFIMCVTFQAAQILMRFYMCCRRGLQAQLKSLPSVDEEQSRISWLAHIQNWMYGCDVEIAQLIPSVDAGCVRSLVLQKLMLERLLGLCILAFVFNFYKLTWSASLTGCFFRRKCTPHVAGTTAEIIIHNLSYWLPDFIGFLYWFIFLLNPHSVQLKSSAEKGQASTKRRSDIIQTSGAITLGSWCFERPSEGPCIELSTNPLVPEVRIRSLSSEITPVGRPDARDLKRLSKKGKQRSVRNLFMSSSNGDDAHSSVSGRKPVVSSLLTNITSHSDCRELHLSLYEMVLVDKRIGLPVPSLFSGRDTFVVMSVSGLDSCEGGKEKRTSGVMERIGDKLRSVSRASKGILPESFFSAEDQNIDNTEMAWKEVARSDCRINEANPEFIVSFIIPVIDDDSDGSNAASVSWRFDIYNENTVDPSFRSELAVLDDQKLIGVIHVANSEFNPRRKRSHSRASHMSWQQDTPDSDDEDEVEQHRIVSDDSGGAVILQRDILVRPYGDNYVRLGGVGIIQARVISPFSQLITELGSVNSMKHPSAFRSSLTAAAEVDGVEKREISAQSTVETAVVARDDANVAGEGVLPQAATPATPTEPEAEPSHEVLMRAFSFSAVVSNATAVRRNMRVVEEMIESPYSFQVPLAYMKCLMLERYMELDILMNRFNIHDAPLDYNGDDWQTEIIASMQRNLMGLKESMREYDSTTATFKPSAKKSDFGLRYIPINLHIQIMTMSGMEKSTDKDTGSVRVADSESSFTCDFVTVGAFAAHPMKFKSGGLWHIMRAFDSRLEKMTKGEVAAPSSGFRAPDEVWNTESLRDLPAEKKLFNLALAARERLDVCLAQCLAAVATGFVSRLQLMSPAALERIATVGLLFQFESLLSTQGSELGMLSDMYCTIRCLNRVHLKIHEDREPVHSGRESRRMSINGPEASVSIYWGNAEGFDDQVLIVDMGFIPKWFARLPQIIKDGKTIPVVPVLFSVGINELQSYAETMNGKKASALQDIINMENLQRVENYCSLVIRLEKGEFDNVASASTADFHQSRSRASSAAADMSTSSSPRSHVPSFRYDSEALQTVGDSKDGHVSSSSSAGPTSVSAVVPTTGAGSEAALTYVGSTKPRTIHDSDDSDAEVCDTENPEYHSNSSCVGGDSVQSEAIRGTDGSEDAGSILSDSLDDRAILHRRSSSNDSDTNIVLRESVVKKAHEHDQGVISRRRQAINRTSTAAALKGGASRRRLSSIMTPTVAAGCSTSMGGSPVSESSMSPPSTATQYNSSLATTATTAGVPLHSSTTPDNRGRTTVALHSADVSSTPSSDEPTIPNRTSHRVSTMKIWEVVEDDSDDEDSIEETSAEDMGVVKNQLLHVTRRGSVTGSGDEEKRRPSPMTVPKKIGIARAPTSCKWNDGVAVDDDDDDQDGVIAIDIEKAIYDHQHHIRDTEASLFERQLSLTHLVSTVTSALPTGRPSSPTASSSRPSASGAVGSGGLSSHTGPAAAVPRRRGTGIAHRLMQYVSHPRPLSFRSKRTASGREQSRSTDDPTSVFGEEGEDAIDVELGLKGVGQAMHNDDSTVGCSATCRPAPLLKSNSSYLRDCLEVRDSSIISPVKAQISEIKQSSSPTDPTMSDFEYRITRLLSYLRHTIKSSAGAGGKPYQILTLAAKLTRALDGVRSTSCKSAKDRTGMSVTLEEASLVKDVYNITAVETKDLLDALRVYGLRLENAKKNVGKATFAFNSIQRRFLPRAYAPPVSVIGNVSS